MKTYIKSFPEEPSFKQKGLNGFVCPLENEVIGNLTLERVHKGHDKYYTNTESSKIYYVIQGQGRFKIKEELYKVHRGDIIEIPPNTEFVFEGQMELLLIMNPKFNPNCEIFGKENDLYNLEP
jgi:mannose-6-phosphate isomerase-like protein (cupin superfamily)